MASSAIDLDTVRDDTLFQRVGAFLADHRLGHVPSLYAFAYEVVANPGGRWQRKSRR